MREKADTDIHLPRVLRTARAWAASAWLGIPALLLLWIHYCDPPHDALGGVSLLFLGMGAFAWSLLRPTSPTAHLAPLSERSCVRLAAIVGLAMVGLLASKHRYQGMLLYPRAEWVRTLVFAAAAAALLLSLFFARSYRWAWIALAGSALAIRALGLRQWSIHPATRDMLALIESALASLLRGENPYDLHVMQTWSVVPLTYPPALWLAFLPAKLLKVDIRWTSWLADACLVLVWARSSLALPRYRGAALITATAYLLLPDVHWNGIYAEPQLDWAIVMIMMLMLAQGRLRAASLLYGVALATRPFNVLFAPFLLLWLLRRFGFRRTWPLMTMALGVAALFYLPFVAWNPHSFTVGALRWLLAYGPAHREWFHDSLGFTGWFYAHGRESWLRPLQWGSFAFVALLASVWMRRPSHLLLFSTFAYAAFVAFNSLLWMSFWIPIPLLLSSAWVAAAQEEAPWQARVESAWIDLVKPALRIAMYGAALASVAACLYLGARVYTAYRRPGLQALHDHLSQRMRAGDRLIDRSGWRVAFLQDPLIFGARDLPKGTNLAVDPSTEVLPIYRAIDWRDARRVWWAELDPPIASPSWVDFPEAKGIYRRVYGRRFGTFTLALYERRALPLEAMLETQIRAVQMLHRGKRQTLPQTQEGWMRPGGQPWESLQRRACAIGGRERPMLWAHPWEGAEVELWLRVPPSARWFVWSGGFVDASVEWGLGDVQLRAQSSRRETLHWVAENRHGLQTRVIAIEGEELRLAFRSDRPDRRHFCMSGSFLAPPGVASTSR